MRFLPPVYAPVTVRAMLRAARCSLQGAAQSSPALPPHGSANTSEEGGDALAGARFSGRRVWLTDSGTSALALALIASQREDRTRVVALPAYCCPDLATAAVAAHFRIRLYDVHPRTLEPDWDSVRTCLAHGASHLVVAHLLGRIVDVSEAKRLAADSGAVVIEDAAQCAGGSRDGVPGGALGDYAIMSFGRGKGLNAGGGGALSVRRGAPIAQLPTLPRRGMGASFKALVTAVATEAMSQPLVYGAPARMPFLGLGNTVYHAPTPPTQPSEATRALIHEALAQEAMHLRQRQGVEAWYQRELDGYSHLLMDPVVPNVQSGALRFPVRATPYTVRDLARYGVVRYYPRTLAAYTEFASYVDATPVSLSGAEELAASLHTLPTHGLVRHGDREAIVRAITSRAAV